ncbi:hypothetical protein PENNAL_c0001G11271 [Penicillium nalgiovense]|uniref:Uncharacterized protein n=1 Tax=Penicillium nalgiovense TaxID=60175 RepID=A0A1V6Z9P3_PENNA|nr:hypothetical protein PENNAL_c0001G11271 [Penicillium nalgiovense]
MVRLSNLIGAVTYACAIKGGRRRIHIIQFTGPTAARSTIEGINTQKTPIITLHSGKDCIVTNTGSAAGSVLVDPDCDSSTSPGGCFQTSTNAHAYGDGRLQRD